MSERESAWREAHMDEWLDAQADERTDDEMRLKAIKLFEAATEPHTDGGEDHAWRECRRCLAIEELATKTGHVLMLVALKALKARETEGR